MNLDLSDINLVAVATVAAALAALASTVTAVVALKHNRRTATATDRAAAATETAAAAQLRAAETTDALHRMEVERAHDELGPKIEMEYARVGPDSLIALKLINPEWRGYRLNATVLRNSGGNPSREPIAAMVELPARGTATIFPVTSKGRPDETVLEAYESLHYRAVLELEYCAGELWKCPCGQPAEYGHWRERRQVPLPDKTQHDL